MVLQWTSLNQVLTVCIQKQKPTPNRQQIEDLLFFYLFRLKKKLHKLLLIDIFDTIQNQIILDKDIEFLPQKKKKKTNVYVLMQKKKL